MAKKYATKNTFETFKKYRMKFFSFTELLKKVQLQKNLTFYEWTNVSNSEAPVWI